MRNKCTNIYTHCVQRIDSCYRPSVILHFQKNENDRKSWIGTHTHTYIHIDTNTS